VEEFLLSKMSIENLSLINFIQLLTSDFLPAIVPLIPSGDKITVPLTDCDKRYVFIFSLCKLQLTIDLI